MLKLPMSNPPFCSWPFSHARYVKATEKIGIVTADERDQIISGLKRVEQEWVSFKLNIPPRTNQRCNYPTFYSQRPQEHLK